MSRVLAITVASGAGKKGYVYTERARPVQLQHWGLTLVALLLLCGSALGSKGSVRGQLPELILVIVVDQLRTDRLSPKLSGGLGQFARAGQQFNNASLGHAISTTCPGHAVVLSGLHPARAGVPDNAYLDRDDWQQRYCVEDAQAPILRSLQSKVEPKVSSQDGRSPRLLGYAGLGDWLVVAHPDATVLSIGAKDRAVIALGGRQPSAAVWFDRALGHFTSSQYYAAQLPPWLGDFGTPGLMQSLPVSWVHPSSSAWGRIDDFDGEDTEFERRSPHPLGQGDVQQRAAQLYSSPQLDLLTLQLARQAIAEQNLLHNGIPDLVAVSLAATDTVGHRYGPYSVESADALNQLDQALGQFFHWLNASGSAPGTDAQKVVAPGVLSVLTADHGVAPLPEWQVKQNSQTCPYGGGRVPVWRVVGGLWWHVYRHFTAPFGSPRQLVNLGGSMIYVSADPQVLGDASHVEVVASVKGYLEAQSYIKTAWTQTELRSPNRKDAAAEAMRVLYANSAGARAGDLLLQVQPGCVVGTDTGTTHGSPYAYDRNIPLVFMGSGIAAKQNPLPARSVDIAPTLAAYLGLPYPVELDGVVLPLR